MHRPDARRFESQRALRPGTDRALARPQPHDLSATGRTANPENQFPGLGVQERGRGDANHIVYPTKPFYGGPQSANGEGTAVVLLTLNLLQHLAYGLNKVKDVDTSILYIPGE